MSRVSLRPFLKKLNIVTHECENYGTFEDWFLNEIDADQANDLRNYGAGCGLGGLINSYEISALFNRFASEIEDCAKDASGSELWEIAKKREVSSVCELVTLLVHGAAEHLALVHKKMFEEDETAEEEEE